MLYLFYGSDTGKAQDAVRAAAMRLAKRAPEAAVIRVSSETEDFDLESLLAAHSLFHAASIIILDGVFEDADGKAQILDRLADLAASDHVFFIREGKLLAPERKKLEKHAASASTFELKETERKEVFNRFALADALLARDKKTLWIRLVQALALGVAPEELHGILFMGAKNLLVASRARSADAAGMKPFTYQNAKRASARFTEAEMKALIGMLAELPHEARRGGMELEFALEQFALTLLEVHPGRSLGVVQ